ncbi:MAG TPA: heterodisulfide reductase-related iron-sulfur binding cluster [Rhizomicrobium sp.]|nr:heterodisulfide reductase-related iron-sulfur binding cluster [Rhizomicrobium sp.]
MRTNFTPQQLADPRIAEAEKSLRTCVHCGICTATCPTYVLLGDERDGPRGRIVMIQQMLEEGGAPSPDAVTHIDRCLSCLACRSACPSSVDYARLIDAARAHVETHHRRPLGERLLRWLIANVMTRSALVRAGLMLAPLGQWLPGRLGAMARVGARARPRAGTLARGEGRRVGLLRGCVQQALAPEIDAAVSRVLARRGIALVPLDADCCGALVHHLGRDASAFSERVAAAAQGFDEVLITATGCSAYLKEISAKARDLLELVDARGRAPRRLRVAWQAPCSLQNGLRLADKGRQLLLDCGYEVLDVPEGHLCCGSAGSYAILQPEIAAELRARKLGNIARLKPDVIATANIGCLHHLSEGGIPIVHYAALVDWADGGAAPDFLR